MVSLNWRHDTLVLAGWIEFTFLLIIGTDCWGIVGEVDYQASKASLPDLLWVSHDNCHPSVHLEPQPIIFQTWLVLLQPTIDFLSMGNWQLIHPSATFFLLLTVLLSKLPGWGLLLKSPYCVLVVAYLEQEGVKEITQELHTWNDILYDKL